MATEANNSAYYGYDAYYDPDESVQLYGVSLGWGKRLKWPDDYFVLTAELAYQRYVLKDWQYFLISNGKCNNISLGLTLSRSSIDNPIFPRTGSEFSFSVNFTRPTPGLTRPTTPSLPPPPVRRTTRTTCRRSTSGWNTTSGSSRHVLHRTEQRQQVPRAHDTCRVRIARSL